MKTFYVNSDVAVINVLDNAVDIEFEYTTPPWAEDSEDSDDYTLYFGAIDGAPFITRIIITLDTVFNKTVDITIQDIATGDSMQLNEFVVFAADL